MQTSRAWYCHRELRRIESELSIIRFEIAPLLSSLDGFKRDMAYQLDNEVTQALEHLTNSVRLAGLLAFELQKP